MKAVILAAGEGRRLEPLTEVRPKPMLPLANKPLLEHVVEAVVDTGIDEIILVVGYKRERIQSHFGDGDDWGAVIKYAVQEKQLGTGHAILQAEPFIEEPFLVLNGDRVIEPRIVETMAGLEGTSETALAVTRSTQPSDYGVVEIEGDRVTGLTEKPPSFAAASDIINAGVYRFDPAFFDTLRDTERDGELTVTAAIAQLLDDGVHAVRYDGLWLDVSHLWDLVEGNATVLDRLGGSSASSAGVHDSAVIADDVSIGAGVTVGANATVLPGTSLGDNVRVGPNAVLSNAVVLADADVGAGATLGDCVIGENGAIGPNVTIAGGPADVIVDGRVHEMVTLGAVVGDNARLGGNVTLAPGTVVGADARVEDGTSLEGRIPSGADVRTG